MRRKQVLIRHFVETAATRTADIEILCVMFDLQDEPDAFTVYQGEVQAIPQTLLNRKVDCWEVENNTFNLPLWRRKNSTYIQTVCNLS